MTGASAPVTISQERFRILRLDPCRSNQVAIMARSATLAMPRPFADPTVALETVTKSVPCRAADRDPLHQYVPPVIEGRSQPRTDAG